MELLDAPVATSQRGRTAFVIETLSFHKVEIIHRSAFGRLLPIYQSSKPAARANLYLMK